MLLSYAARQILTTTQLSFNVRHFMSQKDRRIQEVGFKTDDIINTTQLTYLANAKLNFQNGKCLIYKSNKGLIVTFKRYAGYYSSISLIGALIYANPFQSVFPAAIPILWVLQAILVKMMFKRYQWNQSIVHQIYLNDSGSTAEIKYADNTRRKLLGQPESRVYYNSIFADPIQRQKQQFMPNSNPFPQNVSQFQKQSLSWAWCKYYSNGENYLLIPKDFDTMKKDILVQLFKGKSIKNQ